MKTTIATNQFDQPNLTAAPATPSCCCCCCCCLATVVSTSIIGASSASNTAKLHGVNSGSGALLGALAPFVGLGAVAIGAWLSQDWPLALVFGIAGLMACWVGAFGSIGLQSGEAMSKSLKYLALFAAAFSIEFVVGAFLILMYGVPYLLAAPTMGFLAVRSHNRSKPSHVVGVPRSEETFLLPAPPTGEPFQPSSEPTAVQPLPEPPKR